MAATEEAVLEAAMVMGRVAVEVAPLIFPARTSEAQPTLVWAMHVLLLHYSILETPWARSYSSAVGAS